MKKYLLSLLIVWLSFIWFSSAVNVSWNWSSYSPNLVHFNWWWIFRENFSCNEELNCCMLNVLDSSNSFVCQVSYCNDEWDFFGCDVELEWDYYLIYDPIHDFNWPFTLISISSATSVWWWNEWWNDWWDSELIWQLSPVITWLENSINEFIPYVVYIWLGVLGVIIWFVAIKWLINWVRRQSFWVFSSRKRK